MRLTITSLFSILFLLVSCAPAVEYDHEHAAYDFPVEINGHVQFFTYDATHDLLADHDPNIEHVVFVHHGAAQNPTTYFDNMKAARDMAAVDQPELEIDFNTMVISPAMIGRRHVEDNPGRYENGHYPYWGSGWRAGADSQTEPPVSNFDLLDAMVLYVADNFPNVKSIVHAGHSAGGQVVSRYSVGTTAYDELLERGIYARYIISNPSSFLYLDTRRPDFETGEGFIDYSDEVPVVNGEECERFNNYGYGFDGDVVEYMTRRPVEVMVEEFKERDVFMLQGLEDNDPEGSALDRSCPAMMQGSHRLERGLWYYEYMGELYGPEGFGNKFIETVPDVGHDNALMFGSEEGKRIIFFIHDILE